MTTYTAYFRTDAEWATKQIEAKTPKRALSLARAFYEDHTEELLFQEYGGGFPVNEIAINGPNGEEDLAVWLDDDLRLRIAARDVLDALVLCADQIEHYLVSCEPGKDEDAVAALTAARNAITNARGQP